MDVPRRVGEFALGNKLIKAMQNNKKKLTNVMLMLKKPSMCRIPARRYFIAS